MDSQLGAPVGASLPDPVRTELTDVDRLRVIWAEQRQAQARWARSAARRALTHDRIRTWGGGSELAELWSAEPTEIGPPLTEDHLLELAERTAELSPESRRPRTPLRSEHARALLEVMNLPVHPVVRAAHTYTECARILDELGGGCRETPEEGPPWFLPWVLASQVLQRADHPPLSPDPHTPPPEPPFGPGPEEHFAELVSHFARLVTEALRGELGRSFETAPATERPAPPLAAVTRRRVLDYVRSRSTSVALILRALDPHAEATVTSGDGSRDQAAIPPRFLLTPGTSHWWIRLDLVVGEASLSLYVVIQDVGSPPSGVLAVTAEARLTTPAGVRETLRMSGSDSVTVMPSDCVDDRWPQVRELVDEALSRSMNELTRV
ncbi:hypothetical protein [Nocardiopsis alkaliphila]|uniref:hypothetical protein n=1 Tax=Nocardiopsis alkaliphila TaxID=225762 RepID=UPI0003496BA8|nr:hypothetical protein [Nocardiopsis alkaliphila]